MGKLAQVSRVQGWGRDQWGWGSGRKLGYIELSCGPRERAGTPNKGGGVPGRESGPEVIRLSDLSRFAQNFIWFGH